MKLEKKLILPITDSKTSVKVGVYMQQTIDTEFSYHGISFDERMAIRHLFHNDDDSIVTTEQTHDRSLPERPLQ